MKKPSDKKKRKYLIISCLLILGPVFIIQELGHYSRVFDHHFLSDLREKRRKEHNLNNVDTQSFAYCLDNYPRLAKQVQPYYDILKDYGVGILHENYDYSGNAFDISVTFKQNNKVTYKYGYQKVDNKVKMYVSLQKDDNYTVNDFMVLSDIFELDMEYMYHFISEMIINSQTSGDYEQCHITISENKNVIIETEK